MMGVRRTVLRALALLLGMGPAARRAAADSGCDLAHFGDDTPLKTCARSAEGCLPKYAPEELRRIDRGVVVEWVGLFINDGLASWTALDITQQQLVIVDRLAGRRAQAAPPPAPPTPQRYVRVTQNGTLHWVDQVHIVPLTPQQTAALACPLLPLWQGSSEPLIAPVTDSGASVTLLAPQHAWVQSGPGRATGKARAFVDAAQALAKSSAATPAGK